MASHARTTGDTIILKHSIQKNWFKIITLYKFSSVCSIHECQLTWFAVISSVDCCTYTFVPSYQINACSIIGAWIVPTVICIHFTIPPFKSIWTYTAENRSVTTLTLFSTYIIKIITFLPLARAKEFYFWNNWSHATEFIFYQCNEET